MYWGFWNHTYPTNPWFSQDSTSIESKVRTFDTSGTLFLPLPKSIKKVSVGWDWKEMKTYDPYRHWLYHSGTCSFASSGCVSSVWSSMISWMSFLHRFYHYFWPLRRPHWGSSTQIALRWIKMSASFWLFGLMYTQSTQMLLWNGLRKGKTFLTWLKVYSLEYTVTLKSVVDVHIHDGRCSINVHILNGRYVMFPLEWLEIGMVMSHQNTASDSRLSCIRYKERIHAIDTSNHAVHHTLAICSVFGMKPPH